MGCEIFLISWLVLVIPFGGFLLFHAIKDTNWKAMFSPFSSEYWGD